MNEKYAKEKMDEFIIKMKFLNNRLENLNDKEHLKDIVEKVNRHA